MRRMDRQYLVLLTFAAFRVVDVLAHLVIVAAGVARANAELSGETSQRVPLHTHTLDSP